MNTMKKLSALALLAALGLSATQSFAATDLAVGETKTSAGTVSSISTHFTSQTFQYNFLSGVTGANFTFSFSDAGSDPTSFSVSGATLSNVINGSSYTDYADMYDTAYTFTLSGSAFPGLVNVTVSADYAAPLTIGSEYSLSVTAVPEPESYAMLLAGLGLMVSVARRRSISA